MDYKNFQSEENENLSVEDAKVRELCGGLNRVSVPKDFDFRLKARIANHQPQAAKSPIFAFLKYAAPLGLAIVFLGAIVSNNLYSVDKTAISEVAGNYIEKPRIQQDLPTESATTEPFIAKNNGPNANFETEITNTNQTLVFKEKDGIGKVFDDLKNSRRVENNGGSLDKAATQPKIIQPNGFNNSNRTVETSNNFTRSTSFSVKDILRSTMGIEADFSGNGWKVQSVGQNSIAERTGIKPNDVIEAIGEVKLLTETLQTNSINGKKITVIRDGVRLEMVLK